MKKKLLLASMLVAACGPLHADPGVMLGLSYTFGGTFGVTAKLLSSDKRDQAVVAAGATWYPMAATQKWGVDLGVGYNFNDVGVTVGWDFLQRRAQGAIGFVDTRDR